MDSQFYEVSKKCSTQVTPLVYEALEMTLIVLNVFCSTNVLCRCFDSVASWAVSFLDNSTRLIMACDNNFCAWL